MHPVRNARFVLAASLLCASCSDPLPQEPARDRHDPPTAQRQLVEELYAARDATRHPADGGGRAWLDASDASQARVGRSGRWTIVYEAGPEGVGIGGFVRLTVSAFWEWSPAQTRVPGQPGYTTVECDAHGVELEVAEVPGMWVDLVVRGRKLEPGERIRIVYGAGGAGARADRYAERGSRFWISVDGDGDGVGSVLADSPTVDVAPGPPARLNVVVPSTAEPGEALVLRLAVLDAVANAGASFEGTLRLSATPADGIELPAQVTLRAADGGVRAVEFSASASGIYRIEARGETTHGELVGASNPLLVEHGIAPIRWGDLHGHSNLSDGTGTPEDFLRYARDVAGLDVVALTDHDHWGMLFLDEHDALWQEIRAATEAFSDPGRFVTILGYEWTNWIHGHRHVLYFGDDGPVLSSLDEDYDTPDELWAGLRARELAALTFAHHSAGGPIATNWDYAPDPQLEPLTEVASVHGSSEALDAPRRIYSPLAGNFVRDVLDRGYRLGFVGSGDSHDGHPGLAHLISPYMGGVAAILTDDLTREGVRRALSERRCYATNGPRIVLRTALDGARMGSVVAARSGTSRLDVRVVACASLERLDVIRSGSLVQAVDAEGGWQFAGSLTLQPALEPGEYVYVRVVQTDGGAAWSSPFFVE